MVKSELSQSDCSLSVHSKSVHLKTVDSRTVDSKSMPGQSRASKFGAKFRVPQGVRRAGVAALCLLAALMLPSLAAAQTFTLQASTLSPDAVAPGGTSSSNITVGTLNGFSGSVNLGCQVTTTVQNAVDLPSCSVSPATVTPPASASATITTIGDTTTVSYDVVITGTAPSTGQNITLQPLSLTVLAVTPQFTVTIQRPVAPSSVSAGNGGQGIININPVNGYLSPAGGITLSCSSITPLVTIPPVCSFDPPVVQITGQGTVTSELTISTFGPVTTTAAAHPGHFSPLSYGRLYGLWLPLPLLALVGLGKAAGGKRLRKVGALLALFMITGALFLMPACGNTTTTTTAPNGTTPPNTYTFTVTGVDSDGVIASNTGSTTSANPTVSLTVTAPTP
jgi:hypothetical protein